MAAHSKKKRSALKRRLRHLEAELMSLESGHPSYTDRKRALQQELRLVKAAAAKTAPRRSKSAAGNAPKGRTGAAGSNGGRRRRVPLPGGASFPSFQMPSPKSPTFYEDSIKTLGKARNLHKRTMGYLQRADQWFDALHGFGSHLHQQGVLPKIAQGKLRDLTMNDWSTLFMALMNSPLSGLLLGGGGGGGGSADAPPSQDGN